LSTGRFAVTTNAQQHFTTFPVPPLAPSCPRLRAPMPLMCYLWLQLWCIQKVLNRVAVNLNLNLNLKS